jgi:hypothetical protein
MLSARNAQEKGGRLQTYPKGDRHDPEMVRRTHQTCARGLKTHSAGRLDQQKRPDVCQWLLRVASLCKPSRAVKVPAAPLCLN